MYLFSGKKTKINIQFAENKANCELSPYDTFNHLKQVIIQFFPQITPSHILHMNNIIKSIDDYNDYLQISELSKGKTNLDLTITKPKKGLTSALDLKDIENSSNSIDKLKCKCTLFPISHYCSNCKDFACPECQITHHREHKSISIDVQSIDESVKLFAISLQAEISNEMNNYIQIETMFKENMLIDFFSWKEMIIRKLNKIEIFFKHFEEFEEIFKRKFGTIERMATQTSNKIEKTVNEYSMDKNKMNIDKAKEVIESLSKSGEIIKVLIEENASRREEFNTNNQINGLFGDLDKIIDQVETLSLISYKEIKKKTKTEGEKSNWSLKKDINLHISSTNGINNRYSETKERNNITMIKSKMRNSQLPRSMFDFHQQASHYADTKSKIQSVSVLNDNNQLMQSRYILTDCNRDSNSNVNNKKIYNLRKKTVISAINHPNIVLPQLQSNNK